MSTRYFEDFKVGDIVEAGSRTITKEEVLAFAREFDPQPFHVDEQAAKQSIYGGLIATPRRWAHPASMSCAGSSRCAPATR
jgi:acyl dehydratase